MSWQEENHEDHKLPAWLHKRRGMLEGQRSVQELPAYQKRPALRRSYQEQPTLRRSCNGQSSLEYALVLFAFLSLVLGLAALWRAGQDGRLLTLAKEAASHLFGSGNTLSEVGDLLLF